MLRNTKGLWGTLCTSKKCKGMLLNHKKPEGTLENNKECYSKKLGVIYDIFAHLTNGLQTTTNKKWS